MVCTAGYEFAKFLWLGFASGATSLVPGAVGDSDKELCFETNF